MTSVILDTHTGALELTLRNDARNMMVAWTLDVQVNYADGGSETLHLGVDSWEDAALPNSRPAEISRVIAPGGMLTYKVRVAHPKKRGSLVAVGEAHATSAITADGTPFGDPEMVRVTFMTRARDARRLDALAALLQDADSQAPSPRESVRGAIGRLAANSGLGSWRITAHSRLSLALERADKDGTNPHDDLAALIKDTRTLAAAVKHVTPPAFLVDANTAVLP